MNGIKDQLEVREREQLIGFEIKSDAEMAFLKRNPDIMRLLPVLRVRSKFHFGAPIPFTLELLDEGNEWQTLFFSAEIEAKSELINRFYDTMIEYVHLQLPVIFDRVNFDIRPIR